MKWDPNVLEELKKGNRSVLQGLPSVLILQYGLALQKELLGEDYVTPSPIDDKALERSVMERLKDTGIKEEILKRIEAENKAFDEKVALAKGIER
ncbi:hypothetical protein [Peribacillus simplex]|nr:hypothetical protein [Peribacillus simplex]